MITKYEVRREDSFIIAEEWADISVAIAGNSLEFRGNNPGRIVFRVCARVEGSWCCSYQLILRFLLSSTRDCVLGFLLASTDVTNDKKSSKYREN